MFIISTNNEMFLFHQAFAFRKFENAYNNKNGSFIAIQISNLTNMKVTVNFSVVKK